MTPRRTLFCLAGIVSVVTLAVYLSVLRNGFVNWDDYTYVLENHHIRRMNWSFLRWVFTDVRTDYWLPLAWISHALDYALWGLNPRGHHLTSILLHAANTFIVVYLTATLLRIEQEYREGSGLSPLPASFLPIAAGTAGILFGLHPLHVESVAWVSERKDLLCALFYLLGAVAYLNHGAARSRSFYGVRDFFSRRYYHATLLLFLLALLSKPMAVTLPAVLVLLDWYPLRRVASPKDIIRSFTEKAPLICMAFLASVAAYAAQRESGAVISLGAVPLTARVTTAAGALLGYLGKMAVPVHLLPLYPVPGNLTFRGGLAPVVAVVAVTGAALYQCRKQKLPLAAWLYYIVTLLPVLGLVRVGAVSTADRFTYLPSLGPFFAAGVGAAWIWTRSAPRLKQAAGAAYVLLVIALAAATMNQSALWKDSIVLWSSVIEQEPGRIPMAYNYRGLAFKENGRIDRALDDYTTAIRLSPNYGQAYSNRGIAYEAEGLHALAMQDFNRAVALDPADADGYRWRGAAWKREGDPERALSDLTRAIELRPVDAALYLERGVLHQDGEEYDGAVRDFTAAITLDESYADAYVRRGMVFKETGQLERAIGDYTAAISANPSSAEAYNNRGAAYKHLGRLDRALADYDRAIELNPAFALAYLNRGVVSELEGHMDLAIEDVGRALTADPQFAAAYLVRGELFLSTGRPELAAPDFRKACALGNADGCRALRSGQH